MKIKGKTPPKPASQTVEFPREGGNIVITVAPVMDLYAQYTKQFPEPKPPVQTNRDRTKIVLHEDPTYKKNVETWYRRNTDWLIFMSIRDTEGLEFENVKENDYESLDNVQKELREFLSHGELNVLVDKIHEVSLPSESTIKEAIAVFAQASPEPEGDRTSQSNEQDGTASGGLANDSA